MAPLQIYGKRPVVLLTNDDGPPSPSSPNIFGFAKLLRDRLGWDVRVVIPDTQKSWVGKAYAITEVLTAKFFYPLEPAGLEGEICAVRRPLKKGETMEWVLINGTPASCSNIGLHNLYPGEIDLVISGPNHGRNSSTAFALSSGTLGAALAASISIPIPGPSTGNIPSLHELHMPAIAVSYGVVTKPTPQKTTDLAHEVSADVCLRLFNDWGYERFKNGEKVRTPIYTVNVPLVEEQLLPETRRVCWTKMWKNNYGRLFKFTDLDKAEYDPTVIPSKKETSNSTGAAGPAALPTPSQTPLQQPSSPISPPTGSSSTPTSQISTAATKFRFAPNIGPLLTLSVESLPEGSDAWGFAKGYTTITPMRPEYVVVGDYGGVCEGDDGSSRAPGNIWY